MFEKILGSLSGPKRTLNIVFIEEKGMKIELLWERRDKVRDNRHEAQGLGWIPFEPL